MDNSRDYPKSFSEAMNHLFNGGAVTRKNWGFDYLYIQFEKGKSQGLRREITDEGRSVPYVLTDEDVNETAWYGWYSSAYNRRDMWGSKGRRKKDNKNE